MFLLRHCLIFTAIANCRASSSIRFDPVVEMEVVLWEHEVRPSELITYRTPIIAPRNDGGLIAISEVHSNNSDQTQFLTLAHSKDGEQWFTDNRLVFTNSSHSTHGVNLGQIMNNKEDGTVILFCSRFDQVSNMSATYLIRSHDNGKTWDDPIDLSDVGDEQMPVFTPGPGQAVKIEQNAVCEGRIVSCGHSVVDDDAVVCIYSNDNGITWKAGAKLPAIPYKEKKYVGDFDPGSNQAVELNDGTIFFTITNKLQYHSHSRILAQSTDCGQSINLESVCIKNILPDPASIAGMVYLNDYNLLLHSNALNGREDINMFLNWSYDNGATWSSHDRVQVWPGASGASCLTAIPGRPNYVGLLYEKGDLDRYDAVSFALINLQPRWEDV